MLLYHYCDSASFINIVKKKVLWASDLTKMNDPDETLRGTEIIDSLYRSIFPRSSFSFDNEEKLSEFKDLIVACSMSKVGNLLSQWRAYANDGTGFSIGIDDQELNISNLGPGTGNHIPGYESLGVPGYSISEVLYDEGKYREKWNKDMMDFQKENEHQFKPKRKLICASELFALRRWLEATCLLKNDFYSEEQEVRIFKSVPINRVGVIDFNTGIDFRATSNGIKAFSCIKLNGHGQNCIKEVIIGPKNHSTEDDIKMLLQLSGIEGVKIKRSEGNYR